MGAVTVDGEFLDGLAKAGVQAGSFGGTFAIVLASARWILLWLTGRHDRREDLLEKKDSALDERWTTYTEKIEARCERMEAEVEECHRHKHDLEIRIARLEGFDHGLGDRRQEDQRAVSISRVFGDKGEPQ